MATPGPMFSCNACNRSFRWKPELAGKHVKCKCGASLDVPTEEPAVAPPAPTMPQVPASPTTPRPATDGDSQADSTAASEAADGEKKETLNLVSPIGIGIAVLCLLLIGYTSWRYIYKFTASPTKITTVAEANAMSDGDYVEIELPLSDEGQIIEALVGDDDFAVIPFIGPDKVSLCLLDPGPDPFSEIPDKIVGRVVTKEWTDVWRIYGRGLELGLHKDHKLVTLQLPPAPNDWFTILSVVGLLYLLAFMKDLIWGPEDDEGSSSESEDGAVKVD